MFTLTDGLHATLRTGATTAVVRLVTLWPDGSVRRELSLSRQVIQSGSVGTDLRRDARRTASAQIDNTDGALSPVLGTDELAEGAALRVELGALVGFEPAWVPMMTGYVGPGTSVAMRGAWVTVAVESYLSACRQDAGTGIALPQGMPLPDALHALWDPVLPFASWHVDEATWDRTLGATIPVLPSNQRLEVGLRLARDLGCEAFDDREGAIIVQPRPDPNARQPVREMDDPMDLTRTVVRPPVNAQPVEMTPGDGDPIYVLEEVDDPASPVHRDRIGLRTAPTIRSDATPDPATARTMARSWLSGRALAADRIEATHPAIHWDLDEGDVVSYREAVTRTDGRFVIERLDVPLGPGQLRLGATRVLPLFLEET